MSAAIWLVMGVLVLVTVFALGGSRNWCGCRCTADDCHCGGAHCIVCAGCDYCQDKPRPSCNCDSCKKKAK